MSSERKGAKQSWIVKIQCPRAKQPMWFGNFYAEGRQDAKREARLFVSFHFHYDIKILAISRGKISLNQVGEEFPYEEDRVSFFARIRQRLGLRSKS